MNINDPPSSRFMTLPGMSRQSTNPETVKARSGLPMLRKLNNKVRNHVMAMVGEFVGTFFFLFFAFAATQVANAANRGLGTRDSSLSNLPNVSTLFYISLAFGLSLMVNVWIFFRVSGGVFNPAVTLGLALLGAIGWTRAALIFITQLVAATAASGLVSGLFPGPLDVATTLHDTTSIVRGLFIETFLTAFLCLTIFMTAVEKHKATFLAPVAIGLSLFVCELAGVYFTGGSLNPARSFGPSIARRDFVGYHWIYWVGPFLGALIAVGFYRFIKGLEYETANPGQDFNEQEARVFKFDEEGAMTGEHVQRPSVCVGYPEYVSDGTGMRRSVEVEMNNSIDAPRAVSNAGPLSEHAFRNQVPVIYSRATR